MKTERERILSHLGEDYSEPIRDPVWKHILLSPGLIAVTAARPFQDLANIRQLGPAHLVYPGATHTRLAHSLGTFHVAHLMISGLLKRQPELPVSLEGVRAFLAAALLHDVGHYPFAHSLKNLPVERHEALTARLILDRGLAPVLRDRLGVDPVLVAAIVDREMNAHGSAEVDFFRGLLSGVLDPDKLDYLNRDAYFCGVPYGVQDVDFALSELVHTGTGMALTVKGMTAVEHLLFAKYLMYRTVYWHKTVRTATAMIKKAVHLGLESGTITPEKLYGLSDAGFAALVETHTFEPFSLIRGVFERRLFHRLAVIPFDGANPAHLALEDITAQRDFERALAADASVLTGRTVGEHELVVDVPEPISFETGMCIHDPATGMGTPFAEAGSVFDPMTVESFTRSLRHISLLAARDERLMAAIRDLLASGHPALTGVFGGQAR